MRTIAILTLIGLLAPLAPANADFAIVSAAPATDIAPPAAAPAPIAPTQAPAPSEATPRGKTPPKGAKPHADGLARGFGTQIPLSFAVRQIVPAGVKVIYGRGADQNAHVDWTGGRKWPTVLRDAVRPLGLRLTVSQNAVAIRQ